MNSSCPTQRASIIDGPAQQGRAGLSISPLRAPAAVAREGLCPQQQTPPLSLCPHETRCRHQGPRGVGLLPITARNSLLMPNLDMAKGREKSAHLRGLGASVVLKRVLQSPGRAPPKDEPGLATCRAAGGAGHCQLWSDFHGSRAWAPSRNDRRAQPTPYRKDQARPRLRPSKRCFTASGGGPHGAPVCLQPLGESQLHPPLPSPLPES